MKCKNGLPHKLHWYVIQLCHKSLILKINMGFPPDLKVQISYVVKSVVP